MKKLILVFLSIVVILSIKGLFVLDSKNIKIKNLSTVFEEEFLHFDGPAMYYKIQNTIRTRNNKKFTEYKPGYLAKEMSKIQNSISFRDSKKLDWIERGPSNVGGRTRGLIVDPDDSTHHTWYAGSVGGGIWKTENAGEEWINLTPDFPNLSTSTLAMSAHNTNVIYAGTGEGFDGLMVNGSGIWKSVDKGKTWTILKSTASSDRFQNVLRLIVNPLDENELLACTFSSPRDAVKNSSKSFIMKSTDGGESWEEKYTNESSPIQQIVYTPGNFSVIYASSNRDGILKSTDSGETWEKVFDSSSKGLSRIEMTVSPVNSSVVVLACEKENSSELYISRDSMQTVNKVLFNGDVEANWLGGQGWYDNTIASHPFEENKVWVGGSGAILELNVGSEEKNITVLKKFENNTTFLQDVVTDQLPVGPHGLASKIMGQLLLDPKTTEEDLIDVEIRFGSGIGQKAHRLNLSFSTFEVTYQDYVDVPFEAWDTVNNRQLSLSFIDFDGDGKWTFKDYSDESNATPDVVIVNIIDYSEDPNNTIINSNVAYKGEYYFYMGKTPDFNGSIDDLPEGNIRFMTGVESGVVADYLPVTDGYYQFYNVSAVGSKGVHVDHHNIVLVPVDIDNNLFYVINANDGGVAFSDDSGKTFKQTGDTFKNGTFTTSKGYNVSQFYGVDKMNGGDRYIGGTQDNGTWISPYNPNSETEWKSAPSGDGFEAAWNYADTTQILESSQYNNIFKSTDGGKTWNTVDLPESYGPFLTRITTSQLDPDLVFVCSDKGLIKSTDFGDTWEIKSMPDSWDFSFFGPPTAISLADGNIVWSGSGISEDNRVALSIDKGETWIETANYSIAEMGRLTGIATHPKNPNKAYVMFSLADGPKILKTEDLGKTWMDISGFDTNKDESSNGFPDIATYSLLVMPFDTNRIWAGTELGIYESLDAGKSWQYANNGLPAVGVWQMRIVNNQIVVATHGRGIWTVNTDQMVATKELANEKVDFKIMPNPVTDQAVISFEIFDKSFVSLDLYTIDGKKVKSLMNTNIIGDKRIVFTKGNLRAGTYILTLRTKDGISSKKVIIQ